MSRRTAVALGAVAIVGLAVAAWQLVLPLRMSNDAPRGTPTAPPPVPRAALPDVLVVTIDTLRADRVSSDGHDVETTPTLDRLARTGARFTNAYATSSWTVPSMASLWTGVHATRHGVTEGTVRDGAVYGQQTIPDDVPSLAEQLRRLGYRTFGVVANAHLHSNFGFGRGFDRFECVGFARAPSALAVLERWRDDILGARPYFVWLHLFDPHAPYVPSTQWLARHWDPRPRFPDLEQVHPARRYEEMNVVGDRLAYVETLYDGAVHAGDEALERALGLLDAERRALVLVTSDHGEELADHGRFDHGHSLYEELVRVPLVVRFPDGRFAGRVIETPVSLVDVLPTLAEITGFAPAQAHGRSLLPLLRGEKTAATAIVAEVARGEALAMRREGDEKLIRQLRAPSTSLFFDLDADPDERVSLFEQEGARAAEIERRLLEDLSRWTRPTPSATVPLEGGDVESLRSMGYAE